MNRVVIGAAHRPCTLVVCRGCCCGNPRKHPGTDHAWQLDRLRAAAADSASSFTVRMTDCRAGGRATWIGFAMGDTSTDDLLRWVTDGGPGLADPPATLELQFIHPPREARTRARR